MSASTPPPTSLSPRASVDSLSGIHDHDSSTALILVPEHNDQDDIDAEDPAPFDIMSSSDDDSQDGELQENYDGRDAGRTYPSGPSLSSLAVFLYLLSPLLKLGALLSPLSGGQGLRESLPALFFFATLCALTRQIWYMLARYVRRPDMEEIVLQTFARRAGRGREGERKRRWIVRIVRFNTGLLRVLVIALYLRASTDAIIPALPSNLLSILPSRVVVTLVSTVIVLPLSVSPATSLGASTVIYATWTSVATFVAWTAGTAYAHAKGISVLAQSDSGVGGSLGTLWQGISIVAFTFATSSTLPLYSALRSSRSGLGGATTKRSRSFSLLSLSSIVLATGLILPPTIFSSMVASPDEPFKSLMPSIVLSPIAFKCLMGLLSTLTLALGIPSVLVTAPAIPVPLSFRRHVNHLLVSRVVLLILSLSIALLPAPLVRLASDILIILAFLGTFTIPALLHIIIHNFRRPLSIVMPPTTPRPGGTLQRSDSHNDELLQRKERTLQRRRFTRRLFWDIGVWMLLLPVGGGGLVWAGGRLAGRW
ncbi:hypothetical protein BC835DRAFT_1354479 [Cytidiella melzeri]|nr:hypothetical protein BC835DRAFT_1354479 [Cytidiella melzeri]